MDTPRWSARRCLRLTVLLARMQLQVVPWLVAPTSLAAAAMSSIVARLLVIGWGVSAAVSGFSTLMLAGVVVTMTLALSSSRPDRIALSTPLGPQTVLGARITVVMMTEVVAGMLATACIALWDGRWASDYSTGMAFILFGASWMIPLTLIAGTVTFLSIWSRPWIGAAVGVMMVPFVTQRVRSMLNIVATSHMQEPPQLGGIAIMVVGGLLLLVLAVMSSRTAMAVRHNR